MPVKIISIQPDSIAEEMDIRPNDLLMEINGRQIDDSLDYLFYQTDEKLSLVVMRGELVSNYLIEKEFDEDIGLKLDSIKTRHCGCNCIFCFVDQIHPDARPSLKVKDDDFRLSFIHGNFITFANMGEKDFQRIVVQHLSPLYVSVHATDDELRKKIMRYKRNFSIMERLSYLADNGISMHTQIVLVPGWNDGEGLKKTVFDLSTLFPAVQSIGIVPVGLTKFRENLTPLTKVKKSQVRVLIGQIETWRSQFLDMYGTGFVTLADEFYLLADEPIPPTDYYEDFAQIENGIGMVRDFLENWEFYSSELLEKYDGKKLMLVTGVSFYPVLQKLIDSYNQQYHQKWEVLRVENDFLGKEITVAGLLTGQDVKNALAYKDYDQVILPEEMFNVDGITLDNMNINEIVE